MIHGRWGEIKVSDGDTSGGKDGIANCQTTLYQGGDGGCVIPGRAQVNWLPTLLYQGSC